MTVAAPLVSVTVTTYNHEKYIGDAVQSVLDQTYTDLEVVVVDDGSTDATQARVRAIRDPRLVYIRQENQGPSVTAKTALAACRGKYVALLSGDDILHPERIRRQLAEYIRGERRVLFSLVDHIDDDGRPLPGEFYHDHYTAGRSRAELIERLFHVGCVFFGVTAFTERQVLLEAKPCDPLLLQTQDLDLWIHLIKRYPFQIMPEKLYKFRIRSGHGNLSSPDPERIIRIQNELYLVMRRFFDDLPPDLCKAAFRKQLIDPNFTGETAYACEQAFLFLKSSHGFSQLLGIEMLYQLLGEHESAAVLRDRYGFTPLRFAELLKSINVKNLYAGQASILFVDDGEGWNPEYQLTRLVGVDGKAFTQTFDLTRAPAVRALTWSPLEGWLCRVRIQGVYFRGPDGAVRAVDLRALNTNGVRLPDGTYVFETTEPRIALPVSGAVSSVMIQGELDGEPPWTAVRRLTGSLATLRTSLEATRASHEATRVALEEVRASHEATRASLEEAHASLEAMCASRSWRLTAPLRRLGRLARKAAQVRFGQKPASRGR
jgi:glycosyltransferase involved in cell wall biosynthesis